MTKLPRGVSPKKHLTLRLSTPLFDALVAEEARTGETRTQIVERLLTKGLKMENNTTPGIEIGSISVPTKADDRRVAVVLHVDKITIGDELLDVPHTLNLADEQAVREYIGTIYKGAGWLYQETLD